MVLPGQKFQARKPLPTVCWWWYDTPAILDDYSDTCAVELPAGTVLIVDEVDDQNPPWFLCRMEDEKSLKRLVEGRPINRLFCRPRHFRVELSFQAISEHCVPVNA